jgi:hypothetical protein
METDTVMRDTEDKDTMDTDTVTADTRNADTVNLSTDAIKDVKIAADVTTTPRATDTVPLWSSYDKDKREEGFRSLNTGDAAPGLLVPEPTASESFSADSESGGQVHTTGADDANKEQQPEDAACTSAASVPAPTSSSAASTLLTDGLGSTAAAAATDLSSESSVDGQKRATGGVLMSAFA